MKHEIFHYWAALSLGVPAQIKIGSRFIFIVLETQSDAMNLLERKKRYRFYLSGTVGDLVFLAFVLISKTIINLAGISTFNSIISLVTLQTIVGIIFQLDIFLKTDYYFVFADWFKLDNLYTHSGYILKSWLWRTIPKTKLEKYNQTLIFAIGRLINYIVISLVALMGVFVLLGHFQSINNLNINIGVNILDKLYCLVYILMWGFIFIVRKRKKKKYFIQFE
jgi:hypothetical protein